MPIYPLPFEVGSHIDPIRILSALTIIILKNSKLGHGFRSFEHTVDSAYADRLLD